MLYKLHSIFEKSVLMQPILGKWQKYHLDCVIQDLLALVFGQYHFQIFILLAGFLMFAQILIAHSPNESKYILLFLASFLEI